jgi:hypothetical protein
LILVCAAVVALAGAPPALAETIYGLTTTNLLERFDSSTPGTIDALIPVTGLAPNESLVTIDFRPDGGDLYALSDQSRMYTINLVTGAATQVGSDGAFTLSGNDFGMDFNPVVDRIRVVSDTNQNLRLNPITGELTASDTPLSYGMGDPNFGADPTDVAAAYSNNFPGATTTTLYGIDSVLDILVIQNPPNAGILATVGPISAEASSVAGFDISTGGTAYAMFKATPSSVGNLYTINLVSGAATLVGGIGGTAFIEDIAVQPGPTAVQLRTFSAVRSARGVVLRWRTAGEARTLGYNLYVQRGGKRVRVNRALIGCTFQSAGHSYSYVHRQAGGGAVAYWLEAVGADGTRTWLARARLAA